MSNPGRAFGLGESLKKAAGEERGEVEGTMAEVRHHQSGDPGC